MRQSSSWRRLAGLSLALLLSACTNGGKNQRDTTGMTPGSAGGQLGGASAPAGATTSPVPGAAADSTTSRRDSLGGRAARMMPRAPMMPPAVRDSMHRMMRDTARRRP